MIIIIITIIIIRKRRDGDSGNRGSRQGQWPEKDCGCQETGDGYPKHDDHPNYHDNDDLGGESEYNPFVNNSTQNSQ